MRGKSFKSILCLVAAAIISVGFVNVAPRVIYGDDNRVDVYQVERTDIRDVADSTVALIQTKSLSKIENDFVKARTTEFGASFDLCADEMFYEQPTAAFCSGFLVGEDLIATAGHCIRSTDCKKTAFVFGFKMENTGSVLDTFPPDEVYNCKEVVARELTNNQDYALVRLDRPVRGHRVLNLQQNPVEPGDALFVVGHPSGLPTKVADGATVRSQNSGYFKANTDTYGGNSGSAVFNARTNEVVGILVRGETDFIYDGNKNCYRSKKCATDACGGEDVTHISYISEAIK